LNRTGFPTSLHHQKTGVKIGVKPMNQNNPAKQKHLAGVSRLNNSDKWVI